MDTPFDRTTTIEENFPKIVRPQESEICMLDCKIDVNDTEMPIELEECISEHKRFYYTDHHHVYNRILKHVLAMLDKGLLTDSSGNTLSKDSASVKEYLASDMVKYTQLDEELFGYLYDQLCGLDTIDVSEGGWTKYHDEPDKRTFYKQEGEAVFGSVITDCIIDTDLNRVLACYDNP